MSSQSKSNLPTPTKSNNVSPKSKCPNPNIPTHQIPPSNSSDFQPTLPFSNIPPEELNLHIKLLKQWLVKYNTFDYDNHSASKLSVLNLEDIKIILNNKTNFTNVKLYVDYNELDSLCPNFALNIRKHFIKYYKYVNKLTRKILLTSKKIKPDTSVFSDFILLNYPLVLPKLTEEKAIKIMHRSKGGLISFSKCYVTKVSQPTYLLWSKKEYPKCACRNENFKYRKYFNIFTKNLKFDNFFNNQTKCPMCDKEYYHDPKSDIYIECQEIFLILDSECGLIKNTISVWVFGGLINSVREGNCVAINAYYIPENFNVLEKNFNYGYFIGLNFNMNFVMLQMLSVDNFIMCNSVVKENKSLNKDNIDLQNNEEENNISNLLNKIQFQRMLNNYFYKFLIQNYVFNKKKEVNNFTFFQNLPIVNEVYIPIINIILDLSICQRDYLNHITKIDFLQSSNANYLMEVDNILIKTQNSKNNNLCADNTGSSNINNININNKSILNSRNLLFKSKLFDKSYHNIQKNNNFNNLPFLNPNSIGKCPHSPLIHNKNQSEFKKYFRITRQISEPTNSINDLLLKNFHLFLIFDSTNNDPFMNIVRKYSNCYYKDSLIVQYPQFNKVDKDSLLNFYYKNNSKIVLINDIDMLNKTEIDMIDSIINANYYNSSENSAPNKEKNLLMENCNYLNNINVTFWMCCGSHKVVDGNNCVYDNKGKGKGPGIKTGNNNMITKIKGFENIIQKCEVVMNFSRRNIGQNCNINMINENSVSNFLDDINPTLISDSDLIDKFNYFEFITEKIDISCSKSHFLSSSSKNKLDLNFAPQLNELSEIGDKEFNNSFSAAKLLEDYFIAKRNLIRSITFDDFLNLLRIAIFTSMIRINYLNKKIIIPSVISNINFFDAFISILLYENICAYKYGMEAQNFKLLSEKILFGDYNKIIKDVVDNMIETEKENKNLNQFNNRVNIKKNYEFNSNESGFLPKSKTMKRMNTLNPFGKNPNFFGDMKFEEKNNCEKCQLCSEVDKIQEGKEFICEFMAKVAGFAYGQNDFL